MLHGDSTPENKNAVGQVPNNRQQNLAAWRAACEKSLFLQVYVMGSTSCEDAHKAAQAFETHCQAVSAAGRGGGTASLYVASRWPFPLPIAEWRQNSTATTVARDWSLLENHQLLADTAAPSCGTDAAAPSHSCFGLLDMPTGSTQSTHHR